MAVRNGDKQSFYPIAIGLNSLHAGQCVGLSRKCCAGMTPGFAGRPPLSSFTSVKNLLPQFITQQSGHIFNICSVASSTILDNCTAYTISKHALLGFSHSLRHELKQHQVKVTTVVPGAIYTSSWDGVPVNPDRLMPTQDVAQALADCYQLSKRTLASNRIV